ncbi:hypothetical protein [Alkalibacillus silvisoli]|uniref:DUF4012 domain-containing protein n=1 Tax=Alkalibacillus silvisoli TaxID=392823 RepID=A0ABN1A9K9_9BACI
MKLIKEIIHSLTNTRLKKLIIVLAIILICVGIYLYNVLFNHPMVEYAEVERQTIEQLQEYITPHQEDEMKLSEALANSPSETEFITKGNIQSDENRLSTIRSLLLSTEVNGVRTIAPQQNEVAYQYDIEAMGVHLLEGLLYQNESFIALQADWLLPNSYGIKNQVDMPFLNAVPLNVPKLYEPANHWTVNEMMSRETIEYGLMFVRYISQLNYQLEQGVNGDSERNKLTIELGEQEANDFLEELLEQIVEDDGLSQDLLTEISHMTFSNKVHYQVGFTSEWVEKRELKGNVDYKGRQFDVELLIETDLKDDDFETMINVLIDEVNHEKLLDLQYLAQGEEVQNGFHVDHALFIQDDIASAQAYEAIRLDWATNYTKGRKQTDFELFVADDMIQEPLQGKVTNEYHYEGETGNHHTYVNLILNRDDLDWYDFPVDGLEFSVERDVELADEVNITKIDEETVTWLDEDIFEEIVPLIEQIESRFSSQLDDVLGDLWPF